MSRVLLAWSGGKDSSLSLAALRATPRTEVLGLVTTVSPEYDRISIHGIRREILRAQAASLGLPVFEAPLTSPSSNADYEAAWAAALEAARRAVGPFDALAYGDLFLEDVRRFREEQGRRFGFTPAFPIWGRDTTALAHAFVGDGYEAYLSCVDTTQLAPEFAGRRFDRRLLADLPPGADPCGENGEFHTCVVAGPIFRTPIPVQVAERVRREERFEYAEIRLTAAPAPAGLHASPHRQT